MTRFRMRSTAYRWSGCKSRINSQLQVLEDRCVPTGFVVTSLADGGAGSLREAVDSANKAAGLDTITFSVTGKITLTTGELAISDPVEIHGLGPAQTTIDGNGTSRIFIVNGTGAGAFKLTGVTLTNGGTTTTGGGAVRIAAASSVEMRGVAFVNNVSSSASGGGLFVIADGKVSILIEESTFVGNKATAGGAIAWSAGSGLTSIRNCTFSGNSSSGNGGALATFNSWSGSTQLWNCTLTQNTATAAGGALNQVSGTISIESSVIAGNTAVTTGDLGGAVNLKNSLVGTTDNAFIVDQAGNITGTKASPIDAKLGILANNGGTTQTHALLPGSPAINAGSNPAVLPNDQRGIGFARDVGSVDMGAFEVPTRIAGVVVNNGAVQRSMVTSIKVTFDSPVTLPTNPADAFQLNRNPGGAPVSLAAVQAGNEVTITFTGGSTNGASLADGRYVLTVLAAQVSNGGLDGDGNGVPGDNYVLTGNTTDTPKLFRLFGDGDANGTVNSADFALFRGVFGLSGPSIFDFNNDNSTNAADFAQFRARFGTTI